MDFTIKPMVQAVRKSLGRNYLSYDIETYPNIFTCAVYDHQTGQKMVFEISHRRNDRDLFVEWMTYWSLNKYRMVGYNNLGFDYPVIHFIYNNPVTSDVSVIYQFAQAIIDTPWNERFRNRVAAWLHVVEQVDLYLIKHFDNLNRATSLKQLEFVMRARNIEDLPYPVGQDVPEEGIDNLINYNLHDVMMTYEFFLQCQGDIEFRDAMSEKMGSDYLNFNDTKIGKQFFIEKLEQNGVKCYALEYDQETGRNRKVPIQTHRDFIDLGSVVFDYVKFESDEFNTVLNTIKQKTITETKGALSLSATLNGFKFDFGLGGIHGSVEGQTFYADDEYVIFDWDVASYYPNLGIANRVFPDHLSEVFCDIYEEVYNERKKYAKGTSENKAMKLALNGVYGDSNSKWSSMFDSKYTMTITVNGQLLLCMLAEQLMKIPNMTMIQINTDGLTFKLPRIYIDRMNQICQDWMALTGLVLEDAEYKKMAVRDVNNYIAIYTNDKVKYKGAYNPFGAHLGSDGELDWNQNHSALIVQMAAAKAIVEGVPVRKTILEHTDPMDFMMLAKVGRTMRLEACAPVMWEGTVLNPQIKLYDVQRTTRYYVSNDGVNLIKVMPPLKRRGQKVQMFLPAWEGKKATGLNKNYEAVDQRTYDVARRHGYVTKDGGDFTHGVERRNEVEKGYRVTIANRLVDEWDFNNINYQYYINEAEKLVNAVMQ